MAINFACAQTDTLLLAQLNDSIPLDTITETVTPPKKVEKQYFEYSPKNQSAIAALYADKAYYALVEIRQANISGENVSEKLMDNTDLAIDHLNESLIYSDSCKNLMNDNQFALFYIDESIRRAEKAIDMINELSVAEDSVTISELVFESMILTKRSSAEAYHCSILLKGVNPEKETPEDPVVEDTLLSRIDADASSFDNVKEFYTEKKKEIESRIDQINEKLKDPNLSEEEKKELQKELEGLQNELALVNERIGSTDDQIQNLTEEQKVKNNYLVANLDNYEEWEELEDFPYPLEIDLPKGVVYRIQIGYFPIKRKIIFQVDNVDASRASKKFVRYFMGIYQTYEEASAAKNKIREMFVGDAFLVAYIDGEKVSMSDAKEYELNNPILPEETDVPEGTIDDNPESPETPVETPEGNGGQ